MRLFIAIGIPDPIRRFVGGVQEQLRKSIRGPIRWVEPSNFHFTLKFLGEVPDLREVEIRTTLDSIEGHQFELTLATIAQLPPEGRADVISIDLAEIPTALTTIHEQIGTAFEAIGFPKEDRPFHPHLTLARLSVPRFVSREINMPLAPVKFAVDEILLMRSVLLPAGPAYEIMHRKGLR